MLSTNSTTTEAITVTIGDPPQKDPSISLTKHYKGITLSDDNIRILDIQRGCATIRASRREIFPCLEGEIHLHSQIFAKSLSGRIRPIDFGQGTFLLSDLSYANWRARGFDRVHPKNSIYVNLHHNDSTFRASLKDISIDGMGILGYKTIDPQRQLSVGVNVALDFRLPEVEPLASLAGTLVYRRKISSELIKFGLLLYPNAHQKQTLGQYISQRKDDILDEIYQTYIRSFQPYRVENQYF